MKSKLRLWNRNARKEISTLANRLIARFNGTFSISFVDEILVGDGGIDDTISGSLDVNIGTRGLYKTSFGYVSDFDFVNCVTSMFHEYRHAEQMLVLYHDISDVNLEDNMYLAVNHLACQNNHGGYYLANRIKNPREIDAEHNAVLYAYDYLSERFPGVDCEELILDYVNYKAGNFTYYVSYGDKPFGSLEEVNDAFDQAFENSKVASFCRCECRYDPLRHKKYADNEINHIVGYPEWNELFDRFWNPETNGMQQDKMVAAIELYLHPEYRGFYPVLNRMDLSSKTVFGRSFPEVPETVKQQVERNRQKHNNLLSYTSFDTNNVYEERMKELYDTFSDVLSNDSKKK